MEFTEKTPWICGYIVLFEGEMSRIGIR
jgi:hypothetical protein